MSYYGTFYCYASYQTTLFQFIWYHTILYYIVKSYDSIGQYYITSDVLLSNSNICIHKSVWISEIIKGYIKPTFLSIFYCLLSCHTLLASFDNVKSFCVTLCHMYTQIDIMSPHLTSRYIGTCTALRQITKHYTAYIYVRALHFITCTSTFRLKLHYMGDKTSQHITTLQCITWSNVKIHDNILRHIILHYMSSVTIYPNISFWQYHFSHFIITFNNLIFYYIIFSLLSCVVCYTLSYNISSYHTLQNTYSAYSNYNPHNAYHKDNTYNRSHEETTKTNIHTCLDTCAPTYLQKSKGPYMHACIQEYKQTYAHTHLHVSYVANNQA